MSVTKESTLVEGTESLLRGLIFRGCGLAEISDRVSDRLGFCSSVVVLLDGKPSIACATFPSVSRARIVLMALQGTHLIDRTARTYTRADNDDLAGMP